MHKLIRRLARATLSPLLAAAALSLAAAQADAQCPPDVVTTGLQVPLGITQSNLGNLLVSETGTGAQGSGRISVVDPVSGGRRTLLDGLPSGINDVNEPAGPAGVYMRGRTLYVAIGIGDSIQAGPLPGTAVPNPAGPSSPIFSSVLAVHFSANAERTTGGLTLSPADQQALAAGERVTLSNGGGDRITVELVANFPDLIPSPLPFFPGNVEGSNPFDLVAVGDRLYVTDGGRNLVWRVNTETGEFSALAVFPPIPNPLPVGPPVVQAVPTGITYFEGRLLVTLFRGAPFPPGASQVVAVDPLTGATVPFITGLKTAIDVLPVRERGDTDYLVLQHSSGPVPFFGPPDMPLPGLLLRFEEPDVPPAVVADCLTRPTSMTLDERTGTLYVTELTVTPLNGRVVALRVE